jgi:hypothetical protein
MTGRRVWVLLAASLICIAAAAVAIWRDDILEALLDPKIPYAVYRPPPAPDYGRPAAWALPPGFATNPSAPADVFFVHPTTFNGGRDWNGPVGDKGALRNLRRVMLPNYAGPFAALSRLYAPLYRQASLYTSLTLFDDAIEAREFAYRDVLASFRRFRALAGDRRPFILAGVEQGGVLAARLLREEIAPDPALRRRLVAAYLIETAVPAAEHDAATALTPACQTSTQTDCLLAWISMDRLDFVRANRIRRRARVWDDDGHLVSLAGRSILCVNPVLGRQTSEVADARLNLGAANATGLEWGVRPGFMARQVAAACVDGILQVSRPRSQSLRPAGSWADRLKAPPYNLFWGDLEADAGRRLAAWQRAQPASPAPAS